jgi:uncharacterized protein
MKYLIWLFVVMGAIWWLRQQRTDNTTGQASPSHPQTQTMVACTHCGVHLPEGDALRGSDGVYCSDAHRQRHEG